MLRLPLAIACALAACDGGGELVPTELPACGRLHDGHWDQRFITPGASGTGARVEAIVRMPDGSLIAGGTFDAMSGLGAKNIARWDGSAWSALGDGLPGHITSLAVDDDGQLWAVGQRDGFKGGEDKPFPTSSSYLARWTGTQWMFVVPDAFTIDGVTPFDGGIAVYGSFFSLSGFEAYGIAILRDGAWSSLGTQSSTTLVSAAASGSTLCVGGRVETSFTGIEGVACWNGATWSQLGNTISIPQAIARGNDGTWYIGGTLTVLDGDNPRRGIARLDAEGRWHSLDGGVAPHEDAVGGDAWTPSVSAIAIDGDDVLIAGHFEWVGAADPEVPQSGRMRAFNLARWSPANGWSAMTPPMDLFGQLSTVLPVDGRAYVGGPFARIGLRPGAGIASVEGSAVRSLPEATSVPPQLGQILDLVLQPDGLVLAGRFKTAAANPDDTSDTVESLLRFDGDWHVVDGVPGDFSMAGVSLGDGSYAIRSGDSLHRQLAGQSLQLLCCTENPAAPNIHKRVAGPLVADGNGTLFFIVVTDTDASTTSRIVRATRNDTSLYATAPGDVVAMEIYEGTLYVIVRSSTLGGESAYRYRDDGWELIGVWSDFTNTLVASPRLGLVAAAQGGTRVWNGQEWRTISQTATIDMAACSDGVVAAIDEGDGSRLAFLDDLDGDWEYLGERRSAQWWQIMPTERGIYVGTTFAGGASLDTPISFARWTTSDDTGW